MKDDKKPRFIFKEKVKIIDGFYRGKTGVISSYQRQIIGKFFKPKVTFYDYWLFVDGEKGEIPEYVRVPEEFLMEVK
jgi:hypothetical protein